MASITHYCTKRRTDFRLLALGRCWVVALWLGLCAAVLAPAHAETAADVSGFDVRRIDDELQLSAQLQFDLPAAVEDALLKGIPVSFVMIADVMKDRWYWYDKRLASAQRHIRLAYQPLSRRWRLNVSAGNAAVGLSLSQNFDTLGQAMGAIKRVASWKIAELADLEGAAKCRVEYRFRLDLSQLPRPFQLGSGPSEWDISINAQTSVSLEGGK